MAAEAEAQAKQLDSVTDVVQDTELDASKVKQAMASVGGGGGGGTGTSAAVVSSTFKVSKDHVKAIVDEFDGYVTEDQAERVLRDVHVESKLESGDELLKAALRKLLVG